MHYHQLYLKLFLPALLVSLAGCVSGSDDGRDRPVEMLFEVNPELLGDAVHPDKLGVTFHPPAGWTVLSGELFDDAVDRFAETRTGDLHIQINPLFIFVNRQNGSTMVLSGIDTDDFHSFRTRLRERLEDSDYMETEFLKDGIHFYQYLTREDNIVNFKFLFRNAAAEIFQVDYIVPQAVYAFESKAIESSVGSIHLITH